jgi:hypothetical protein
MSFDSEEKMYEMLGRYITGFEDFCRSIQDRIIDVLTIQGLRNSDVHEIILEGLTAAPLLSKLQALVNSVVAKNEEEKKVFSKVFSQFHEIIEQRNIFFHSHWLPFATNEQGALQFHIAGSKLGSNKNGAATKISNPTVEDFEFSIERCHDARHQLALIMRIVLGYRTLFECFEINGKVLKVKYEALKPIPSE